VTVVYANSVDFIYDDLPVGCVLSVDDTRVSVGVRAAVTLRVVTVVVRVEHRRSTWRHIQFRHVHQA
jgi:hypothetical protein